MSLLGEKMPSKKVSDSTTIINKIMMPEDANTIGNVHGGAVLRMIDEAAFICASRHSNSDCVTAYIERVIFRKPIKVGEVVTCKAFVNYVGETSMVIEVIVEAENLHSAETKHTNSCHVIMVAIDGKGNPKKVPDLILASDEEKKKYEEGKKIKENIKNILKKENGA